ncbi:MAG: TIGR01777 family oxidoreductase [Flavobacteriaceae bacterium]|nr:TIGR01777 family oxidoreductase [Flavobacteriaceae bacterium]
MKILITGATGMIGGELVDMFHDMGVEINYLTTSKNKIKSDSNYKGFYWNPSQGEIDLNCFKEVTVIVNLVGANVASRWTNAYKKEIINSRVESAQTLIKGLRETNHDVEYLISASAIGIYPNSLTKLYEENETDLNNEFIGDVVQKWENAVDEFKEVGLKVAKLRIGLVLSDEGGALEKMKKPIELYAGAPLGSGKQWQSWIHIDDLCNLFIHCIKQQEEGVFNAVAPNPVNNKELTLAIAKILNKPIFLPNVPAFMLKLMLGEMSTIVLSSQYVSSKKIESTGFEFTYTHVNKALENLLQ